MQPPAAEQPPSLWLDEPYRPRQPPRGTSRCDIAVVGAGMTGASAALALAGHGASVTVLEAHQAASRASGRNAGFVITNLAECYAALAARIGRAATREVWRVNEANRERVAALVASHAIACGFTRTGSWCAAADEAEAGQLRASAAMMLQDGLDARFHEPPQAAALLGPAGEHGALERPGDGQIHPARFVRGLVAAAEARGVRVHEGARVAALERDGPKGPWTLRGEGFAVEAERVLVCANYLAPALHPWFGDKLRPVRGQVLATEPLAAAALPRVPGPVYADHGYDYWRLHEGRLVLGGRRPVARDEEVGTEERLHPRVQGALDQLLARLVLGAAPRVTHRWAGIMDFSRDGFPLIGPVPGEDGLLAAVGFTGHGFGYATVAGDWLAGMALGRASPRDVPPSLRADRDLGPGPGPP